MSGISQSFRRAEVAPQWDAVVIGSGIGGLSAAALLARAGQRVLVLERHSTAGGATQTFRRAGYEWDAGVHYVGQVHRPTSGLRRVFDYITDGALQWEPMDPVYNRIVVGERTYDYPSGAEAFTRQMKQYFPDDAAAIDRYIELVTRADRAGRSFFTHRALPAEVAADTYEQMCAPMRAYSDRTVSQVLDELTENTELKTVLCGHCGDYSLNPGRASFAVHAMLIRHYIDGASFPVGGSARFVETIGAVIAAAGGTILVSAEVSAIEVTDTGHSSGVVMADGRVFRAPSVISDAGVLNTLTELLPAGTGDPDLIDGCRSVGPSLPWVVLNIGARGTHEELGLGRGNIWIHQPSGIDARVSAYEADPHHRDMPLYFLTFPSAKDPSWPDRYPGRATIDIAGMTSWELFAPFADTTWMRRGDDYEQLKTKLTDELLTQVLRFCPQLQGRIEHVELATPLSFNHFLHRQYGDFMSLAASPERFALTGLSAHAGIPNLYLTGQDVTAAGVVGAVTGGIVAASAVLGRDALADLPAPVTPPTA